MTDAELRELAEKGSRRGMGVLGKDAQDLAEGCLALLDRFVGMKHQHRIFQDRYLKDIDERAPHLYVESARLNARLAEMDADYATLFVESVQLKARLAEVDAKREDLQQKLTERFDDEVLNMVPKSEAERGEVVKACPECGAYLIAQGPSGRWVCGRCNIGFAEPAYWQRVDGRQS